MLEDATRSARHVVSFFKKKEMLDGLKDIGIPNIIHVFASDVI